MLVQLINIPSSEEEWGIWSYHHRLSHDAISQAIRQQKGLDLTDYIIDPVPTTAFPDWLDRNQQLHIEMDAAIGAQSVDLQDVNPKDANEMAAWVYIHWLEHQTAERVLKIGS